MFVLRRQAARVVLIDDRARALLITAHDPRRPSEPSWLELPGGGIDPGEPSAATCVRELREEVGIEGAILGPVVWTQRCRFEFGGFRFDQQEVIHVARCEADPPRRSTALEALEALAFERADWFTYEELIANRQRTLPPRLRELIEPLFALAELPLAELPLVGLPLADPPLAGLAEAESPASGPNVGWPKIEPLDITDENDWTW